MSDLPPLPASHVQAPPAPPSPGRDSPPIIRPTPLYPAPDTGPPPPVSSPTLGAPPRRRGTHPPRPTRTFTLQGRSLKDVIKAARQRTKTEADLSNLGRRDPAEVLAKSATLPATTTASRTPSTSRKAYFDIPTTPREQGYPSLERAKSGMLRKMERTEGNVLKSLGHEKEMLLDDPEAVDAQSIRSEEPEEMSLPPISSWSHHYHVPVSAFLPPEATTISHGNISSMAGRGSPSAGLNGSARMPPRAYDGPRHTSGPPFKSAPSDPFRDA